MSCILKPLLIFPDIRIIVNCSFHRKFKVSRTGGLNSMTSYISYQEIGSLKYSARAAIIKNFLQVDRAGTGAIRGEDFRRDPAFRSVLFQSVCKVSCPS